MLVRVRLTKNSSLRGIRKGRAAAAILSLVSATSAVAAWALAYWCIAAELRWTKGFIVSRGIFSHWHAWVISAMVLVAGLPALNIYVSGRGPEASR